MKSFLNHRVSDGKIKILLVSPSQGGCLILLPPEIQFQQAKDLYWKIRNHWNSQRTKTDRLEFIIQYGDSDHSFIQIRCKPKDISSELALWLPENLPGISKDSILIYKNLL